MQWAHAVDRHVVEAALAQLLRQARDRHALELLAKPRGEPLRGGVLGRRFERRKTGDLARAPRLLALGVIDGGERSDARVEGDIGTVDHRRDEATRGVAGCRGIHFDLDDVARDDDGGPGGSAREDDVAALEREVLREVGDELREREHQPRGRVVLAQFAVHPCAHAQRRGVDRARIDEVRAEGSEAFAALRAHVGALVVAAQIVEAEVVRGRHPADVVPGISEGDAPRRLADHERDLALEGQQLGAGGAGDRAAGRGDGAGRLQEVGGCGGAAPALVGTGGVAQVHRDDLAGAHRKGGEPGIRCVVVTGHELPRSNIHSCVVFEIVYDHLQVGKRFSDPALTTTTSPFDTGVTL